MIAAVDAVALVVVGMATPSRSGRSTSVRRRVLPSSPGAGCGASRFERRPGGSASPAHRRVDRQSTPFGSMAQGIRGAVPTGRDPRQRPQNQSRKTPSWARVLSELWGRYGETIRQPSNPPGPEHPSPCSPSSPSRTSHGTIKSAQPGSAHHHPDAALAPSPNSRVNDKYEHASVSFASARSAALPMCPATWSLPHDSNGMTARESTARTMPTALASGARRVHNVTLAWATTYNASSSNVTPTNRCTQRSVRAMCNASAPRTSTVSLQSMSAAAAISITLSSPKPRSATLSATAPAQSATTASMTLYAIVQATSPTAILTHPPGSRLDMGDIDVRTFPPARPRTTRRRRGAETASVASPSRGEFSSALPVASARHRVGRSPRPLGAADRALTG